MTEHGQLVKSLFGALCGAFALGWGDWASRGWPMSGVWPGSGVC